MKEKLSPLQVQEFMDYFTGSVHNYGEHTYVEVEDGKKEKGHSKTITNRLLTIDMYEQHLKGLKGLGVIPINEDSKCKFGVIDVDIYSRDLTLYVEAIERNRLPLVPFRSKSGGLHLYLFLKEFVPASQVQKVLRQLSFLLSIDLLVKQTQNTMVEIFPKQSKLEKGKQGSWINLPYFNYTDTKQYVVHQSQALSLTEGLIHIKKNQIHMKDLNERLSEMDFNTAPPCLQLINILSPLEDGGGRNNYLFSMGVFLKKQDEDFFGERLMEINSNLKNPLPPDEVETTILSSLRRKEYMYKCNEEPCVSYCNKKECQKREFGIGKNDGYFSNVQYGQLIQFKTAQPYYEWEVRLQNQEGFKVLRFKSEDEIIKQDTFLRLCMRELHELPSKLKQTEWFKQVNQALKEIKIVNVEEEEDTSPISILRELIFEFLVGRTMAQSKDQILAKRVYYEPQDREYLFRVKDLTEFVYVKKQFRYFTPQELHGLLREFDCMDKRIRTESGKQVRVKTFPEGKISEKADTEAFQPDFSKYDPGEF